MEDGKHRTVGDGVQELVRMPARCQRTGFRLAISDDATNEQVRVVERGSVRVQERVSELASFVDRAGSLGGGMARDTTRERELSEEDPQALEVAGDTRV